ncbi:MAG: sigma-54 interaction domain-containing protein [Negativicutes bacterium]
MAIINLTVLVLDELRDAKTVNRRMYKYNNVECDITIIFTSPVLLSKLLLEHKVDIIVDSSNLSGCVPKEINEKIVSGKSAKLIQMLLQEISLLEHSKEELKAILNSTSEGIEASDIYGNITNVNPAFSHITGIEYEDRVGKNIFDVNRDGVLATVLRTKKPVPGSLRQGPGSKREVIVTGAPIIQDETMLGAVVVIHDVSEAIRLAKEVETGKEILTSLYNHLGQVSYTFKDIVAESKSMKDAIGIARKAARSSSTVLIMGGSGTGKELFAQSIHAESRPSQPFVAVNCAAIPESLLEEELFGHEKGAFTGASGNKIGLFELAKNGTVFLDEIGDLNLNLQAKLLRVLQEREFRKVGGVKVIPFKARIIAATNRNILKMVSQGMFRDDLYYRLNVITIRVASLAERTDDLPKLTEVLLQKISRRIGKKVINIEKSVLEAMSGYSWPGNVRELQNVLERAVNMCEGDTIGNQDIDSYLLHYEHGPCNEMDFSLEVMEKKQIDSSLAHFGSDLKGKKAAAKALGISLTTLYQKLKKYNINQK